MKRTLKRSIPLCALTLSLLFGAALWLHSPYLRRAQAGGNAWTIKTGLNAPRSGAGAAEINGKLYVVGGSSSNVLLNTLVVYDPATDTWTNKTSMPTARVTVAAATINGKLYAVGGQRPGVPLNTLEVYDPATDTWMTKTGMNRPRSFFAAAALNGKLYAVGGYDGSGNTNTLEVYDPATDTWTDKTGMSEARGSLAVAALNGKLYAVGGSSPSSAYSNVLEVYDPVTDTWTTKTSMPTARQSLAAVALNGQLYAVGGFADTIIFNTLEVYDPTTNTWTTKTGMPTARRNLAAAAINGQLFAVGGGTNLEVYTTPEPNAWASKANMPTARATLATAEINDKLYFAGGNGTPIWNKLEVYDPATNTWMSKTNIPTERLGLAAAAINGKLYVVGGNSHVDVVNTLEVYDPATDTWTSKTPMPTARVYLAAAAINGKLYVVGGQHHSTLDTLEVYDPATDTWTSKTPMPTARTSLAAAAINGKLYVIGGVNASSFSVNTLEVYDPTTDTWTSKTGMPTPRSSLAAATLNGKLYVVGGRLSGDALNTLEVYDPATDTWTGKATMPTERHSLAAATLNGKLYVAGGVTVNFVKTLEVFQVASDLTLDKSHSGDFTAGTDGGYTLTVSNAADANCTEGAITVTDTLPNGLSYVSASDTNWNCAASGQTVTCTNTSLTLDAGESASFLLNVHANAPGNVTNYASVATPDEIITNNNEANDGQGDPTTITCPTITGTVMGSAMFCDSGTATITVTVSGGVAPYIVKLNNNGGTQTGTVNQTQFFFPVSPVSTTTYALEIGSVDKNGCPISSNSSATVTVNPIPATPTITPNGPTAFCAGGNVVLRSSSATGNQWYLNGSPLSGATEQTFTATATGNYSVQVTTNGCSSSLSGLTPVQVTPNPTPANAGPDQNLCGLTTTLAANLPSVGTGAWSLVNGPGTVNFSNAQMPNTTVTASAGGTYRLRWTTTNGSCSSTDEVDVYFQVVTVNPATLNSGTVGQPYSAALSGLPVGGNYSFALTGGALPNGLTLTANGTLSGTPSQANSFNFTVQATAANGCAGTRTYTLVVNCPAVSFTPASLPNANVGAAYQATVTASPAGTTYSYLLLGSPLPPGLSLDSATGLISGTPTAAGNYAFVITALGWGDCRAQQTYNLLVTATCPTVTLTPSSLAGGTVGTSYSQSLTASGATGPFTWAVTSGSLPAGLTLTSGGSLTGTPTTAGSFNFTVTATNGSGCAGSQSFTLVVTCPTLTLEPASLTNATAGVAYNQSFTLTPSGAATFSLATGSLPPGLSLTSAGTLSGTATATGSYSFSVKAERGSCNVTKAYSLVVACPTVAVNPTSLANGAVGSAYNQTLSATPSGSYSFVVSAGTLPGGVTLSTAGVLSGTPTASGTFSFTVRATAFGNCSGTRNFTLTIGAACPTVSLPSLANATRGVNYYGDLSATTPSGSYTFSLSSGTLPPGLVIDNLFGALTGTPTTAGTFAFTLQATNATGCSGTRAYSFVVSSGAAARAEVADYDGDGTSDLVRGAATNEGWQIRLSQTQTTQQTKWGGPGDVPLRGDYDGDGRTDLAVFRPANGTWYLQQSRDGSSQTPVWGGANDLPVPGDYDADGKTDLAVFRPAEGNWYVRLSGTGRYTITAWGLGSAPYLDIPVPGDYDGDGRTDLAVFRRATGTWLVKRSSDEQFITQAWGQATDVPVAADYDGDGQTDIAVWRGKTGDWFVLQSADQRYQVTTWGATAAGDVPVVGDYDGDGLADLAVWRAPAERWYIRGSAAAMPLVVTQTSAEAPPSNSTATGLR